MNTLLVERDMADHKLTGPDWNTSSLDALCTDACNESLKSLAETVESSCGDDTYNFNGENHTWSEQIEFFQYKYDMMCLKDRDTGEFCHDVEDRWNITSMVEEGNATWPENTAKCYMDLSTGSFEVIRYDNGTCKDIFSEIESKYGTHDGQYESEPVALDYYFDRVAAIDDDNFGWAEPLDADEYPLEIQCSSCHLDRLKHGLESKFGEPWDNVAEQVWSNIQANCNITDTITPALNFTGVSQDPSLLVDNTTVDLSRCAQQIEVEDGADCTGIGLKYSVPTAALESLNPGQYCYWLTAEPLCAPPKCPVALHTGETVPFTAFVGSYTNFTMVQFLGWNRFLSAKTVLEGDVVCVGPSDPYVPPTDGITA